MGNKTTVNRGSNGQYRTTVPRDLAEAFDLDGERLEWGVKSGSTLEVAIVDD
jgi:hypothetical protein